MCTPAQALTAGPVAVPPLPPARAPPRDPIPQTRQLKVPDNGVVTVGKSRINLGSHHRGQRITVVFSGYVISVFHPNDRLIRTVHIEPGRTFYGNGKPPEADHDTNVRTNLRHPNCPDQPET